MVMILRGELHGVKSLPLPLYPPHISHGLGWGRNRVFVVECRRLTAWVVVQRSNKT